MSIKIVVTDKKKVNLSNQLQGGLGHLAASQSLHLSGWEGKMEQSALIMAARKQREHCVYRLFPFSSYISPGTPSYMVMPPTLKEGSPPLKGSPSQTHPEACFMNLLGKSQCNQADSQDYPHFPISAGSPLL